MTQGEKSQSIGGLIALIPYTLVAWAFTKFDPSVSFGAALGVLIAIRLGFAIIETAGGLLAWHLHGRAVAVHNTLRLLRENRFPPRYFRRDDFLSYLSRIESDDDIDANLRRTARETKKMLGMFEDLGILVGMRMHSASEAALEIYSPRARAPEFV